MLVVSSVVMVVVTASLESGWIYLWFMFVFCSAVVVVWVISVAMIVMMIMVVVLGWKVYVRVCIICATVVFCWLCICMVCARFLI